MSVRGESPTFAMFCTMGEAIFLFAEVSDEIEAVECFHKHVGRFSPSHVPHIHMEPMRDEWHLRRHVDRDEIDPARNLFRAPAGVSA